MWLRGLVNELKGVAEANEVRSGNWEAMEPIFNSVANKRKETFGFLFFITADGSYYKSNSGKADGNLSGRDYFQEIMYNGKMFSISNPVISKLTGKKRCNIAVAVKNVYGEPIGIIAGSVIISKMADIVTDSDWRKRIWLYCR